MYGETGLSQGYIQRYCNTLRSVQGWTEPFLETLSDMGIPVSAGTKAGFYESIEILTMTNLLRIIDNPRQDIPLVSVLRSVFVGLSDDELAAIAVMPRTLDYWDAMSLFVKTVRKEDGTEKYMTNIVLDEKKQMSWQTDWKILWIN